MKRVLSLCLCFFCVVTLYADGFYGADGWSAIQSDYRYFYSGDTFKAMALSTVLAGSLANSSLDQRFQDFYQEQIRSERLNKISSVVKPFGSGRYVLPVMFLFSAIFSDTSGVGEWASLSSRAYLVGAPLMLMGQRVLGASRPGETSHGSHWRPFNDANAVSGHAFIGAVPFLVMAKLLDDYPAFSALAYAASVAVAWSRVNDDSHYLSQAFLGCFLAWQAVDAVFRTRDDNRQGVGLGLSSFGTDSVSLSQKKGVVFKPLLLSAGTGMMMTYTF
ncbi:MAG: phosphatase PAP2 family protein [bacterium]